MRQMRSLRMSELLKILLFRMWRNFFASFPRVAGYPLISSKL